MRQLTVNGPPRYVLVVGCQISFEKLGRHRLDRYRRSVRAEALRRQALALSDSRLVSYCILASAPLDRLGGFYILGAHCHAFAEIARGTAIDNLFPTKAEGLVPDGVASVLLRYAV